MNMTIQPGGVQGSVRIPSSKSQAHRLLIGAALSDATTTISCDGISDDIAATIGCLRALGAEINDDGGDLSVRPVRTTPVGKCNLFCGESGSTLRFLLPVAGALGAEAVFHMDGCLPERPLAPLDELLIGHGISLKREKNIISCNGKLQPGTFTVPGNISSQYVSGLLLALPLLDSDSIIEVTGTVESSSYIEMTENVLKSGGIRFQKDGWKYSISGRQRYSLPYKLTVEGDWSSAAFPLCAGALSENGVTVYGLNFDSAQGDKQILSFLEQFGATVELGADSAFVKYAPLKGITVDAGNVPDLVPVLSAVAAFAKGESVIKNAGRLRLKESDRLRTVCDTLGKLGADIEEQQNGLIIRGRESLSGGTVDSFADHRIAMMAAVASCRCTSPVTVTGVQCISKSYPRFRADFEMLKGVRQ